MKLTIVLGSLLSSIGCFEDPGIVLMECIDGGNSVDSCTAQTIENFRGSMQTGIAQLGLPPLDPIYIQQIDFRFFNLTIAFKDVDMEGFKNFKLEKSVVDKDERTWKVELSLPRVDAVGLYKMTGTVPPNLDLGSSEGDERFSADRLYAISNIKLGKKGSKIEVVDMDLQISLDDMHLELECLFPRAGQCCPDKYLKSCNTILAKTVLRFINKDGKNFVPKFQPEISRNIKPILQNYFAKAIASTEAGYLINV